ncbi:hypothetical protein N431DRAFT_487265 [Stipitochalara longipes BDJ]|nr:hypothetical protein N431DRAFT_487265 [Stipitochalara longipes BDJ]
MRFPRRLSGRLLSIIGLIALSVIAIVSIGEAFKAVLVRRDVDKLEKRDGSSTVTLDMPWELVNAVAKPEAKDIVQDEDSLIGDIAAVASAILGGAERVAAAASAGAAGLEVTSLPAGSSVFGDGKADSSNVLQDVSGQIQQATSIVAAIIGDATSIVGSILAAATSPSNIGVLPIGNSNSSMNGTLLSSTSLTSSAMSSNSSLLPFPPNTTITATPCPSSAFAPATIGLSSAPSAPFCPTTITETCTVTETWHSTHYAETATFYSFVANSTATYTETASGCPPPLYLADPTTTISPLQGLIACANGVLAKRQEDCPYNLNATSPFLNASAAAAALANSLASTHPCPNAGYSCGDCPDGWFCPPYPTAAQSCACGYGWACANCKDGYFCIPNPTSAGNGLIHTVASLPATSAASLLESSTTGLATLQSLGFIVPITTGTVTCIDGSVVMVANDCLNGVCAPTNNVGITINTLAGRLLSTAQADDSSLLRTAQPVAAGLGNLALFSTPNVANQLSPQTSALPAIPNPNPTALSEISKLMLAGVPTNLPVVNTQPNAAVLGDAARITLPIVTAGAITPALNNLPSSMLSATTKRASNAAENMFNQLMNGLPTNSPVLSSPTIQMPPAPALGIARGRRRG